MPTVPQRTDRHLDHRVPQLITALLEEVNYLTRIQGQDQAGDLTAQTASLALADVHNHLSWAQMNLLAPLRREVRAAEIREAEDTRDAATHVGAPPRPAVGAEGAFMRDLSAAVAREHLRAVAIETAGRSEADCG
jgi:hypothetical protein